MSNICQMKSRLDSNGRSPGGGGQLLLACLFFGLIGAITAPSALAEEYVTNDWQFTVTPYLWALSLDGHVTVKGRTSEADVSFSDIFDDLNFAIMLEAEARKNRLGLFVNPLYAALEDDTDRLEIDMHMALVEFGGYYRLGPWPLAPQAGASGPVLVTDLYAGGRYTYLYTELKGRRFGIVDVDGDQGWVDPIVGARTLWFLSPKWTLSIGGNIGGFGLGSDFTWAATGLVGYNFHLFGKAKARVFAGYRALSQDYDTGSGNDKFEWDETLYGPIFGLSLHF